MSRGILGQLDLAGGSFQELYDVPVGQAATCNINVCNRGATPASVSIAIATGLSGSPLLPDDASYIEYGVTISANGVLERTGIIVQAGYSIYVYSDTPDVSAAVYGITVASS